MNSYSLEDYLASKLNGCESTLKQTSYDRNNSEFLCQDESLSNVYNFDLYVERATNKKQKKPASPDAVVVGGKKLYFVEFKNQKRRDVDRSGIRSKFVQGTEVLKKLLETFKPRDRKYCFCVVYQNNTGRHSYSHYIESRGVQFGLKELNEEAGGFYDEIYTQPVEFYAGQFRQLNC